MPLAVTKLSSASSDRVKGVDQHPEETWLLSSLHTGTVNLRDTQTSNVVKSWKVCDVPVRCCKFIARQGQFVCGSDDCRLRTYDCATGEKVADFEAHSDFVRYVDVHPTEPLALSCGDDKAVKLWNWDRNWSSVRSFEGHDHYVMMATFNGAKDTFATASLDKSVKVWGIGGERAQFSLEGHDKGVNCVAYDATGAYLVSGADDFLVKVWDCATKACLHTLQGHAGNVTAVLFHPSLPVVASASEDRTVKLWRFAQSDEPEETVDYGLERAWCLSVKTNDGPLAVGYDQGSLLLALNDN